MIIEVLDLVMIILSDKFNTGMLIMPSNGIWSRNYVVITTDVCGNTNKIVVEYLDIWGASVIVSPFSFSMILPSLRYYLSLIEGETVCQKWLPCFEQYYSDVIMGAMVSQITSLTIVYSTVYSDRDQRKHQSYASLAFVRVIHRWPTVVHTLKRNRSFYR